MLAFVVRRLCWAVVLACIISLFTFIIFFVIPTDTRSGGPVARGPIEPTLQGQFNLRQKSVPEQYAHFLSRVVRHGDLGYSIRSEVPVSQIIGRALPVTASLVIGGAILWMLMAIPIGI